MIAQIPISQPTANSRLAQLTRLTSASVGHVDAGPAGHRFPQPGQQVLVLLERDVSKQYSGQSRQSRPSRSPGPTALAS